MRSLLPLLFTLLAGCPGFGTKSSSNGILAEVPDFPTYSEHIKLVMDAHCISCHNDDPPPNGTPKTFRLDVFTSQEKFGTFDVRDRVLARSLDLGNPMPPIPNDFNEPLLDAVELETLQRWLDNGAPEGTAVPPISITGTFTDMATKELAAEGLCAAIIDPGPIFGDGDDITLGTATLDADGAFSIADISPNAEVGLLASLADCDGAEEPTQWTSQTNIFPSELETLSDINTLDITAPAVSLATLAEIEDGLDTADESRDAATVGAMIAWVRDSEGNNIAGATVECEGCGPIYYFDQDASDGLFTSAAGLNTATDEGGRLLILAAPHSTYTPAADGYEFDGTLAGGSEGVATCTEFKAK